MYFPPLHTGGLSGIGSMTPPPNAVEATIPYEALSGIFQNLTFLPPHFGYHIHAVSTRSTYIGMLYTNAFSPYVSIRAHVQCIHVSCLHVSCNVFKVHTLLHSCWIVYWYGFKIVWLGCITADLNTEIRNCSHLFLVWWHETRSWTMFEPDCCSYFWIRQNYRLPWCNALFCLAYGRTDVTPPSYGGHTLGKKSNSSVCTGATL